MAIRKKSNGKISLKSENVTAEKVQEFVDELKSNDVEYSYMSPADENYPSKGYRLGDVIELCMELKKIPKGIEKRLVKLGYPIS